jgi:hypothetical protein
MTTGRNRLIDWRVYVDGYDLSGYSRSFGPLVCTFEEGVDDAVTLTVKGMLAGNANIGLGTLNGLFDNTTAGLHEVAKSAGVKRNIMLACGIQAAPADNDPVFSGAFQQNGYSAEPDNQMVYVTIPFSGSGGASGNNEYAKPWGVLLHSKAARTAANTATGLDQTAQSTKGGWMMYHAFAGNGTAAIKVQDASTNLDGSFSDLLTSGVIDCSTPKHGIVTLAKTATVKRYVRWQIALGTATTVTFVISFHRNNL